MIKEYIQCGEVVGTHGIHGEVRVNPWCDSPQFLSDFKFLFLDENGKTTLRVKQFKRAKNVAVIKFEGYNTIEQAKALKNRILYIKRSDADIGDGHFINEMIGCSVLNEEGEKLGVIDDILSLPANDVWQIKDGKKEYLFPAVDEYIISVDVEKEKVIIRPMKGIFDDED